MEKILEKTSMDISGKYIKDLFPYLDTKCITYDVLHGKDFSSNFSVKNYLKNTTKRFSSRHYPIRSSDKKIIGGVLLLESRDPLTTAAQDGLESTDELSNRNTDLENQLRQASDELLFAEERFGLVSLATNDAIWDWDLKTNDIWWNEGYKSLFGYSADEISPKIDSWMSNLHPEDSERVLDDIHSAIAEKRKQWTAEYRFKRKDDSYAYVYDRGYCLYNEANEPFRMLGSMMDLTKLNSKEEELKKLASIVQRSSDFIGYANLNGQSVFINEAGRKMIGIEPKDDVGTIPIVDYFLSEDREFVNTSILPQMMEKGKWEGEFRFRHLRTGHPIHVYCNIFTTTDPVSGQVNGYATVTKDITQIKSQEREFKFVTDFMPQLAWSALNDGYHDYYNKRWYEYTGLSYEQTKNEGWSLVLHPDDYERAWKVWSESLAIGKNYEIEYRFKKHDGTYRWFLGRALPLRDYQGKIIKWFGTCTDIHDQKMAINNLADTKRQLNSINVEITKKNEELTRINSDLDNFIYTASHDLKAPINNIEGLMITLQDLLSVESKTNGDVGYVLTMIDLSVERFKNTIKDLTDVAKVQSDGAEDITKVNFKQLLEEVKFNIKDLIYKSNAVILDDFSEVDSVKFSQKNLRSIIYNLVSNAVKYRSPDRAPEVSIQTKRIDEGCILLTVKDNGLGINKVDQEKVFVMFKRLHSHVEGTGVGMSIVKKIIDNAGGRIEIESEVGKGTIFRIYLHNFN
jgi:PAS domain S-box-containing protein